MTAVKPELENMTLGFMFSWLKNKQMTGCYGTKNFRTTITHSKLI